MVTPNSVRRVATIDATPSTISTLSGPQFNRDVPAPPIRML
jgi:hypothetical protein